MPSTLSFILLFMFSVIVNCYDINSAMDTLSRYGYLPMKNSTKSSQLYDVQTFSKAVSVFQKNAGLPVTGKLDKATEDKLQAPRCGLSDPQPGKFEKYVLASRWQKRQLSYRVVQYTEKLSRQDVDREISKAFAMWEKYAPLTFTQLTSGKADIEIRFTLNGVGNTKFDGVGGVLAFAFYPQKGDIYFDEAEPWTVNRRGGTSLFYVAVHEMGHSLGLAHSNIRDAVMYPWYKADYPDLGADDIAGIEALYGKKTTTNGGTTTSNLPPVVPSPTRRPQRPQFRPQYPYYPNNWPRYPYPQGHWNRNNQIYHNHQ